MRQVGKKLYILMDLKHLDTAKKNETSFVSLMLLHIFLFPQIIYKNEITYQSGVCK